MRVWVVIGGIDNSYAMPAAGRLDNMMLNGFSNRDLGRVFLKDPARQQKVGQRRQ
jgi:hypothetical protein